MVTMEGHSPRTRVTLSEEQPREEEPRRKARSPRRRRIQRVVIVLSVLLLVVGAGLVVAYQKLEGNINAVSIAEQLGDDRPDQVEVEGPSRPLNILVMGSDDRKGTDIGGKTPGLSDTTILLHLSADRKRAYGVSLPRDAIVDRPECASKDGRKRVAGGVTQFNEAYAVGGPACTVKTVESLTDIRIDHFVVVNFVGFKEMVNAINGVTVCVPNKVDDDVGKIYLPKGTYKVNGKQALDYVRVRYDLGAPNGDIGRMKRQQSFIASMVEKVVSKGTLVNPVRLYRFLNAATKSLTTDTDFASLGKLASLGTSLKDIGLDNVQFVTVPNQPYPADANRLQWAPEAEGLWRRIRLDQSLGTYGSDAVTPGREPGEPPGGAASASPSPGKSTSSSPSAAPSQDQLQREEARKEAAREAGLCA